jgi:hypothetical protein
LRRLVSAGIAVVAVLVILAGAVALIGAYTFLPPFLEASVARDVRDRLALTETPEVRLESEPQPAVLAGSFSGGRVSLRGVSLGGARAGSAVVNLDPFEVDLSRSLIRGETVGEEPLSGDLRVRVSETEISRLVGEAADTPVSGVELEEGRMVARSATSVFGIEVPISVSGNLDLRGGDLVFEPRSLEAAGIPVPDDVSDQLLEEAAFAYPLEGLLDGARVTGVRVEKDSLVLTGRIEEIPLGSPG